MFLSVLLFVPHVTRVSLCAWVPGDLREHSGRAASSAVSHQQPARTSASLPAAALSSRGGLGGFNAV